MLGQLVQNTWREKETRDTKWANEQVQRRAVPQQATHPFYVHREWKIRW